MENTKSPVIRFLYNTTGGRMLLKIMVRPRFSSLAYHYLASPLSKWLIKYYVKKYDIDMERYHKSEYDSFNDFFTRQKADALAQSASSALIAPCDGYLSVYPISPDLTFTVKNVTYDLPALLHDKQLAEKYNEGCCMVFRLAPQNYHRYIFVDNGEITSERSIAGVLQCVRPEICGKLPVYVQNSREYIVIDSDNFGSMIQMEVGALLIGRIKNHAHQSKATKYAEKGYFEFGGSTIILFFEKDRVMPDENILKASARYHETPVTIGEKVGVKNNEYYL